MPRGSIRQGLQKRHFYNSRGARGTRFGPMGYKAETRFALKGWFEQRPIPLPIAGASHFSGVGARENGWRRATTPGVRLGEPVEIRRAASLRNSMRRPA
jgi:hypothetical protein